MAQTKRRRKKRKLRKFRIPKIKFKKPNVKLRKEVWYVIFGIVALLCLIFIPRAVNTSKLKKLGYKKDEIAAIRTQKLSRTLLDNQWYSPYLATSIKNGTLDQDYMELYTVVSEERGLNATDFLLVNRLKDKGYVDSQILNLFKNLRRFEITPLLVFDYQYDENMYIKDCQEHADVNNEEHFELSGSYYTFYKDVYPVDDPGNVNMLVNKTYYLDASYEPPNLTDLSIQYAARDRQLAGVAAEALAEWGAAGRNVGVTFYATSAYRSFDQQDTLYHGYVRSMGEQQADAYSARAGYSEHQTGYTVDIAATNEDDIDEFKDTLAYRWTSLNSHTYGWILRYPLGKEIITGYDFESWHYRYLGKDLATAVYNSKLTYDEFYCLYLKPWANEENTPRQDILEASDYHQFLNVSEEETTEE